MLRKCAISVVVLAISCLLTTGSIRAEEEDDYGKGKGKGASPGGKVVQVDLSKLPPDLAKALAKYGAGGEGKGKAAASAPSKGKPQPAKKPAAPAAKGKGAAQLPPGLASKPANHPGRTHYIQHVLRGKSA